MITLFGIKNCDACRKARKWLEERNIAHQFHDLREDGLDRGQLQDWMNALGWQQLLNRRSTTWRALSGSDRTDMTAEKAMDLIMAHPTLIKRPVFALKDEFMVGFSKTVTDRISNQF